MSRSVSAVVWLFMLSVLACDDGSLENDTASEEPSVDAMTMVEREQDVTHTNFDHGPTSDAASAPFREQLCGSADLAEILDPPPTLLQRMLYQFPVPRMPSDREDDDEGEPCSSEHYGEEVHI